MNVPEPYRDLVRLREAAAQTPKGEQFASLLDLLFAPSGGRPRILFYGTPNAHPIVHGVLPGHPLEGLLKQANIQRMRFVRIRRDVRDSEIRIRFSGGVRDGVHDEEDEALICQIFATFDDKEERGIRTYIQNNGHPPPLFIRGTPAEIAEWLEYPPAEIEEAIARNLVESIEFRVKENALRGEDVRLSSAVELLFANFDDPHLAPEIKKNAYHIHFLCSANDHSLKEYYDVFESAMREVEKVSALPDEECAEILGRTAFFTTYDRQYLMEATRFFDEHGKSWIPTDRFDAKLETGTAVRAASFFLPVRDLERVWRAIPVHMAPKDLLDALGTLTMRMALPSFLLAETLSKMANGKQVEEIHETWWKITILERLSKEMEDKLTKIEDSEKFLEELWYIISKSELDDNLLDTCKKIVQDNTGFLGGIKDPENVVSELLKAIQHAMIKSKDLDLIERGPKLSLPILKYSYDLIGNERTKALADCVREIVKSSLPEVSVEPNAKAEDQAREQGNSMKTQPEIPDDLQQAEPETAQSQSSDRQEE